MNYSNQRNRTEQNGTVRFQPSSTEYIAWLAVFMTEAVAVVTLNIITIIVFMKNCSLRKRSMYLVINLAVADMLVGGFSEIVDFFFIGVDFCNFWQYNMSLSGIWDNVIFSMEMLFPITSFTNLAAISLERIYATFFPFKHRVIGKWIFGVIIAVVWVLAVLPTTAIIVVRNLDNVGLFMPIWQGFNFICLLVICVSYASIAVKIYRGARPQHHGATRRERKLSMTLFIVTLVSLLTALPRVIIILIDDVTEVFSDISRLGSSRTNYSLLVLFYANSFINPILYTFRMPEFKRALVSLFRRSAQQQGQVRVFPLRAM